MKNVSTLNELLSQDEHCRALYSQLPRSAQVALQEQRQHICTREELAKAVSAFEKQPHH